MRGKYLLVGACARLLLALMVWVSKRGVGEGDVRDRDLVWNAGTREYGFIAGSAATRGANPSKLSCHPPDTTRPVAPT